MNIIEAIKSGNRFRKKGGEWQVVKDHTNFVTLSISELLSDDWEIEADAVTITALEFDKKAAWILTGWEYNETDDAYGAVRCALENLRKELGL